MLLYPNLMLMITSNRFDLDAQLRQKASESVPLYQFVTSAQWTPVAKFASCLAGTWGVLVHRQRLFGVCVGKASRGIPFCTETVEN